MALAETIIATIAALAVSKGIDGLQAKKQGDNVVITQNGKELARIPNIAINPYRTVKVLFGRAGNITTITRPDKPQVKKENPFDSDRVVITNLAIIPSNSFKTKGHAIVRLNEVAILEIENGDLTDIEDLNIGFDQGVEFRRGSSMDMSIWSDDGTTVSCSLIAVVGVN